MYGWKLQYTSASGKPGATRCASAQLSTEGCETRRGLSNARERATRAPVGVQTHNVHARITGTATVNGVSGRSFTLTIADNGEPGRGVDQFRTGHEQQFAPNEAQARAQWSRITDSLRRIGLPN